ncbi:MAG: IS630 family transposase [Chloroflexota bacterium]
MEALSLDLRERIIKTWQRGQPKMRIAKLFMVSLSSVKRYVKQFQMEGHVWPKIQRRVTSKVMNKRWRKRLIQQVEQYPDYTLAQHMQVWNARYSLHVSESGLIRAFRRLGLTRKKKTLGTIERDEAARAIFREVIRRLNAEDVVVVDESGSRIGMVPLYARSLRGQRVYDRTIGNYGQNVTLLASMNLQGMQAAMTVEGSVTEAVFESFIREVLLPTLRPGHLVILDNLSSHKTQAVEQLVIKAGCQLLFLPAYSPDFSPIEEAFSKLKAFIRQCRCQTVPELIQAIGRGLEKITTSDAKGWFAHAGFLV